MNLAALMNDGGEESNGKRETSPVVQRTSQPLASSPVTNGHHVQGYAQAPVQPQARPPSYPPPPLVSARSSGSHGLTPLHTPGQAVPGNHYPFPGTPGQASTGPDYRYRTQDGFSATTPGGRAPSYGPQYPLQPSPSLGGSVHLPLQPTSASPTPSSHHSQHTPHSVRQSPLAVMAHPPQQPPPSAGVYQQYQHSQPSTPLGPPQLHSQRSVGNYPDLTSPFHQRTFSGASNGVNQSPAAISSIIESPNAFHRPSPIAYQRHSSQYLNQHADRERSLSVSPKTKVAPRPSSMGSRHSSLQEVPPSSSSRSSIQQQASVQLPHNHIPQAQTQFQQPGAVAQTQPQPLPNLNGTGTIGVSQSAFSNKSPSLPQSQNNFTNRDSSTAEMAQTNVVAQLTPSSNISSPPQAKPRYSNTNTTAVTTTMDDVTELAQTNQLKRSAPEAAHDPPAKRKMVRKYTTRPPWASLSKHNPRAQQQDQYPVTRQPQQQQQQQPNGTTSKMNGTANKDAKPWQQDPPLDDDLIKTRGILGKWEKSFRWNMPYPDMLKAVQDWLYVQLSELQDVGMDPREGAVEIEARVGILKQSGTDDRCRLPVRNATVIDPAANSHYHFESRMTVGEHKAMNEYLNSSTQQSMEPGRTPMQYKHLYETDSFDVLSPLGLSALPTSLQRRSERQRPPRLRTTRDSRTGQILGRIVKIHISDLHIFNPQWNYDTRISIALEVNLDRPDLDPQSLIAVPGSSPGERAPERIKDRLSYKHLAYSIDLTKVSNPGPGSDVSYELEVEVESRVLREQMARMADGRDSAFGDVVSGFLDNITFLTRQGPN